MPLWFNYSAIFDEEISPNDPQFWNRPTAINCDIVRTTGIFLCIAACLGILLNGSLVCAFIRHPTLRSSSNVYIMFIAIMGFLASCTILPSTGTSSIHCQWLYKRLGCQLEAMIAFWYGCSSSYLLCVVSLSRCYIIIYPFDASKLTIGKSIAVSSFAVFLALIWSLLPMFGWNEYIMEAARTSCCINWFDRRFSYVSFTFFLFIFVYILPLLIIVISNTITLLALKEMRDKIKHGIRTTLNRKRIEMERRILNSILTTTCGFIITWTPYAIAMFVSAFRGKDLAISPLITFFCACFAKSSVIWIPLFYIATSTQFHFSLVNLKGSKSLNESVTMKPDVSRSLDVVHQDDGSTLIRTVNQNSLKSKASTASGKAGNI